MVLAIRVEYACGATRVAVANYLAKLFARQVLVAVQVHGVDQVRQCVDAVARFEANQQSG